MIRLISSLNSWEHGFRPKHQIHYNDVWYNIRFEFGENHIPKNTEVWEAERKGSFEFKVIHPDTVFGPGDILILEKHHVPCFSFEIEKIFGIDPVDIKTYFDVTLLEDYKIPNEFYLVYERDSDVSIIRRHVEFTMESALNKIEQYERGEIQHAFLNDYHTTIVYEKK